MSGPLNADAIRAGAAAAGSAAAYSIDQSIRFNDNDSAYLSRTPSSAGNRRTFTFSCWVKRANITSANCPILSAGGDEWLMFLSGDTLGFNQDGSNNYRIVTSQVFRDAGAWFNLVLRVDTTNSTAGDRFRLYINGSEVTDFGTDTNPPLNYETAINNTVEHDIGKLVGSSAFFDGYLAEINHVDGSSLAPTEFAETNSDTGQWVPKKYTGSYGTNGFYITGEDSSDLGDDESGNGNDFTSSGLTAADQVSDSPTNNFWTLNPNDPFSSSITISDGNLRAVMGATTTGSVFAPMLPATGKWAWKVTATLNMGSGTEYPVLGIVPANNADVSSPMRAGGTGEGYGADGRFFSASAGSNSAYGQTWADGDVIEVGWDADNGALYFWHNGAAQGLAKTGLTGRWKPAQDHYSAAGGDTTTDFGQLGYSPTDSSYKTLCTANLPDPAISDPKRYFGTLLYTGNGTTGQTVTGLETSDGTSWTPDWVWIKPRSQAYNSKLFDSVRTLGFSLESSTANAEADLSAEFIAFADGGFQVDDNGSNNINQSGVTHVAWCWEAGGSGSSNSDGSVTSSVSNNSTANFSVVKYTGTGSGNSTVGHGLGTTPTFIIAKHLDRSQNWRVFHTEEGVGETGFLNSTAAFSADSDRISAVSSTTFTAAANMNESAEYIAYCFADVEGYSKFGDFTGNGSTDGPFVTTNFKPAWLLIKRATSGTGNWDIFDNKRDPINVADAVLDADANSAEATFSTIKIDLLSNGFKIRGTQSNINASGSTYIYVAFAESPFKTATAR